MTAICGSGIVVSFKDGAAAYQVVAGLRTRRMTINSEDVDVTNADSSGIWRELLSGCGVRSVDIQGDGIFQDDAGFEAMRDAMFDNENRDAKIFFPGYGTFEGSFKVSSLDFGGDYNAAATFSTQLRSAGAVTFSAA